jgi:hypothetical protein
MPSASVLQVNARGLVTAPNPLLVPRDALIVADNVVFERPGYIQSRRGLKRYTYGVGGQTWAVVPYAQQVVANYGTAGGAVNLRANSSSDGTGTWASISGSVWNDPSLGERMHGAEALGSLYLTCQQGVQKLTGTTLIPAGLPKSIGLDRYGPTNVLVDTGGFLADGQCVAYRAVVGRGTGGNIQLGAPGSRNVVANATGTTGYGAGVARNATVRVLLPKANNTASTALTTDYFIQLYRSGQVAVGQTPSDEMQLVFEAYLTATNISNGYVDVTDKQPDALRGAYLYTNPNTGEEGVRVGILNANAPPPTAWDVAMWRDCAWYADRARGATGSGRQRLVFQILGTGTGGLAVGNTFTIAGVTYTAISPPTPPAVPAANQFAVESSGTASANIEATATNLVAAINKSASNTTVYAYYVSGSAPDAPGKVLVESRLDTGSPFTALASANGTAYVPSLAVAASSTADGAGNRLYFSKPGQPEAVPVVNFLEVGPTGSNILRIIPLGSQLYVVTDAGLYRVLGSDYTNWDVNPVDLTCICAAPETCCTLDGSLFFLTSQGAVEVTEGSVSYISGDIDSDLRTVLQSLLYNPSTGGRPLALYAFAVAHLLDHRVLFWLPASVSATACSYAYVYDRRARSWSRWYRTASDLASAQTHSCGCYSQGGPTAVGMTLGGNATADGWCFIERRAFSKNDYADSTDAGATTTIKRSVTWAYQDAGDAAAGKHWREVQFLFGDDRPRAVTVTLATETQAATTAEETASVTTTYSTPVNNKMHRLPVGRDCGRAARMAVTLASAELSLGFDVAGMALHFRPYGPRLTRGP